ncbi:zinc finger protein-like 1 homolog [Thrips palmi]|uniref:Zinc finger protein-like 1 homolog n=1 Tax=Thrips palmi TaxID=161013 RepID=A0A6P8ZYU7_THRPL|nr:zinc finger protein-like 1 homolog [Thrips palmi]XP_034249931.1 zinc finger protein-like 1 homolog [Thrips palmi]
MGLCKCPKKRVTNQFCFEHRVNVCEYCMVTNHSKCVVQSYLQWLQDSDYTPICELCTRELSTEDCVRLVCYHVFHWGCLDAHARRLPATTAPAGYTCPFANCSQVLFPAANLVSPVADVLREKLAGVNWARAGLGLPLLSEDREIKPPSEGRKLVTDFNGPNGSQIPQVNHSNSISNNAVNNSRSSDRAPSPHSVVDVEESLSNYSYPVSGQAPRRVFQALDDSRDTLFDHDENKYKRRSAIDMFRRWWKQQTNRGGSRQSQRRCMMVASLISFTIGLLIFCSWAGRRATEDDPNLDPMHNPNIHVQNIE